MEKRRQIPGGNVFFTPNKKNIPVSKMCAGYLSLEASFIVPLIFMIMMLVIYFVFFLYNHMVVAGACYQAALRGSELKNAKDSVVEKYTQEELDELLDMQIYQFQIEGDARVTPVSVSVSAHSHIENKLQKLGIYEQRNLVSEKKRTVRRIDPAVLIRASLVRK